MSTKIYYAWRVPTRRLNSFIDLARAQVIPAAVKHLVDAMSVPTEEALGPEPDWLKGSPRGYDRAKVAWRAARRFEIIEAMCKEDAKSSQRSDIDVQCWLNVWVHNDGHAYVMPIAENWLRAKIVPPKWAPSFAYWNNTDPPKGMRSGAGYKRWEARRKVWDKLCCGQGTADHNARRLSHAIVEVGHFGFGYHFGAMAREAYEKRALRK